MFSYAVIKDKLQILVNFHIVTEYQHSTYKSKFPSVYLYIHFQNCSFFAVLNDLLFALFMDVVILFNNVFDQENEEEVKRELIICTSNKKAIITDRPTDTYRVASILHIKLSFNKCTLFTVSLSYLF